MGQKIKNELTPINTGNELDLVTHYTLAECIDRLQTIAQRRDLPIRVTTRQASNDTYKFTVVYTDEDMVKTTIHGTFTAQLDGTTLVESAIPAPINLPDPVKNVILLLGGVIAVAMLLKNDEGGLFVVVWVIVIALKFSQKADTPDGRYVLNLLEQTYTQDKRT